MNQYNSPHDVANVYHVKDLWSELATESDILSIPQQIAWSILDTLDPQQLNWLLPQILIQTLNNGEYQIKYDLMCRELRKPLNSLSIDSISLDELAYNTNLLKGIVAVTNREIIDTLETKLTMAQKSYLDSLVAGKIKLLTDPSQKISSWIQKLDQKEWQALLGTINNLAAFRRIRNIEFFQEYFPAFHAPYFGNYFFRDQDSLLLIHAGQDFFEILDSNQQNNFQHFFQSIRPLQNEFDSLLELNYLQLWGDSLDLDAFYTLLTENGVTEGRIAGRKARYFAQLLCDLQDHQIEQLVGIRDTTIALQNQQICPSSNQEIIYTSSAEYLLFPNPAYHAITIRLPENFTVGRIEVFDLKGSELIVRKLKPGISHFDIHIGHLPSGYYRVKMLSPQGISSLPFIKR